MKRRLGFDKRRRFGSPILGRLRLSDIEERVVISLVRRARSGCRLNCQNGVVD
jgi:hypothetical protein